MLVCLQLHQLALSLCQGGSCSRWECRLGHWSRHPRIQGWRELSRDALVTGTHTAD